MELKSSIFAKYLRALYNINLKKTNKIHSIIIDSIYKVFVQMEEDVNLMSLEVCLTTANEKWLDLWGDYFGIPRKNGETDDKYRARMIAEIIEPKSTISSLKKATARWLNFTYYGDFEPDDIVVYEPWRDLLVTSQRGAISYLGRLSDSEYWTHGVVDISIPDSSEMSSELIEYLNTIKACGIKISWHIDMNWKVLEGYFGKDSVECFLLHYYDIWLKRGQDGLNGVRTSCEWTNMDEEYNTPLSTSGYLSGKILNRFEQDTCREFEPFRFTNHIVQSSPIINLDDIAYFSEVSFEDLTIQQLSDTELTGDRQIPNLDNISNIFEQELARYSINYIGDILNEFGSISLEQLTESSFRDKTVSHLISMFDEDIEGMNTFLKDWRNHNYFNKPVISSPISICAGPLKILIETDT